MNLYKSREPSVLTALKNQNLISSSGMVKSLAKAVKFLISEGFYAVASLPTADKPPSNIASMVKQCEAKGRKDLGEKILVQWAKVLDKYPAARLNWAAACTIGGASIKKNVFGGVEFVDWFTAKLKMAPEEAAEVPSIPTVELAPNTPAIAIPKVGETPEDWKDAAAETASMLKNAEKAFKYVDEFLEYLNKEIADLERKVSEYGPGGKKHLLKSGQPHSMAQRVPKWEAQLQAYSAKLKETTASVNGAEKKFAEAAESYSVAPVTTVEFESKAQDSLTGVLEFILDIKDIKKQKQLLDKFKESLERMENEKVAANVSASVVMAEGVGTFIESLWDKVKGFWDSVIKWCFGLSDAVDAFHGVAHMVETTATASTKGESRESENPLQLWSMTKAEYEAKYGKPRSNTTATGKFSAHKSAVQIALNQGKPVPAEVLKDYPELKGEFLTEGGHGLQYMFRAEGLRDVMEFLKKVNCSAYTITCELQPDVECEITSAVPLSEIKKVLKTIPDSHVMLETVALKSEYTGERKHED